ncbi:Germination protease [Clostridium bornimense]|uniref:Germination protease n=1 Tax=Clostridium bornimense TaxID=1216932 RepID=W6SG16_9CLOT|nr:GPR endopeptidase [Clostridium bornimense]CDM68645.1 Germination protease [Clostridium bornimense]
MYNYSIRTDLAVEAKEMIEETSRPKSIEGVEATEKEEDNVKTTTVIIKNAEGAKKMGRAEGTYITIEIPDHVHYDEDTKESVARSLAKELTSVLKIDEDKVVLVVGLGNWNVTPDSLGPKVVSKIMVTRHLKELVPDEIDEGIRPVCAISPGVLGITGMETSEIVKGIVERVKPDVLICIDALASRRLNRVNTTIQIGTSGIAPGAGVGNKRKELSEKTLGIPVIAIGVPTVVDAATMASDTIDLVIDDLIRESTKGGDFYKILKGIDREDKHKLITALLTPEVGDLIVTPKEVDDVIESISKIIANGINIALQPALELSDINRYLN